MPRKGRNGLVRGVALAAVATAIVLLAGCGGDDDDSPTSGADSAATVPEQPEGGGQNPEEFGEAAGAADRAAAGGAVQDFLRAQANGDGARACSLMSGSVKENLELFLEGEASEKVQNTCAELVDALRKQIPADRLPQGQGTEVIGMRIEGDRGFVIYREEDGGRIAFPVIREDGTWKVAAIAGTNLP